jgi:hypothetical protein
MNLAETRFRRVIRQPESGQLRQAYRRLRKERTEEIEKLAAERGIVNPKRRLASVCRTEARTISPISLVRDELLQPFAAAAAYLIAFPPHIPSSREGSNAGMGRACWPVKVPIWW